MDLSGQSVCGACAPDRLASKAEYEAAAKKAAAQKTTAQEGEEQSKPAPAPAPAPSSRVAEGWVAASTYVALARHRRTTQAPKIDAATNRPQQKQKQTKKHPPKQPPKQPSPAPSPAEPILVGVDAVALPMEVKVKPSVEQEPEHILDGVPEVAEAESLALLACAVQRSISQESTEETEEAAQPAQPAADPATAATLAADAEMAARLMAEDEQLVAAAVAAEVPPEVAMELARSRRGAAAAVSQFPHLAASLNRAALTVLVAAEGGVDDGYRVAATLALRYKVWQCRNKERVYHSYTKEKSEAAMQRWSASKPHLP